MNVALDTNAYSDFLRGTPSRVEIGRRANLIFLPLVVLAELRAGFAAGNREAENLETLRRFRASPRVSVLQPDEATTEHYARVFLQLRQQGSVIFNRLLKDVDRNVTSKNVLGLLLSGNQRRPGEGEEQRLGHPLAPWFCRASVVRKSANRMASAQELNR